MDLLNITEKTFSDESLEEYEYHEYNVVTGLELNTNGEKRIYTNTQDIFYHPSESYLLSEGKLCKQKAVRYVVGDMISLTKNGLMFLFESVSYRLSRQEIETFKAPRSIDNNVRSC